MRLHCANHTTALVQLGLLAAILGVLCALLPLQVHKAYAETYGAATIVSDTAQQTAATSTPSATRGIAYVRVGKTIIYENKAITQSASVGTKVPRIPAGTKAGSVKGVTFNSRTNTLVLSKYSAKALKTYPSWTFEGGSVHKAHIFIAGTADSASSVTVMLKGTNKLTNPYRCSSTNKPYFIGAEGCKLTVKGSGTMQTKKCNGIRCSQDVRVESGIYRIDRCGTQGGAICAPNSNVLISKAAKMYLKGANAKGTDQLIHASRCSNSYTSFKQLWGVLCYGATFKAVQNSNGKRIALGVYQVTSRGARNYTVKLIRLNKLSSLAASTRTIRIDRLRSLTSTTRCPYVTGIASTAFQMKGARFVTSVSLADHVNDIDKNAFKPLKRLKTLYVRCGTNSKLLYCKNRKWASRDTSKMSTHAFAGLNKSCLVSIDYYNKKRLTKSRIAAKCRGILEQYGLPKKVKMQVNYSYYDYWGEAYSRASSLGKRIVAAARNTPSPEGNWCAKWVLEVYARLGIKDIKGGHASDLYYDWCTSSQCSDLKVGMVIAVPTHDYGGGNGRAYGHAGIYIGNNRVMHLERDLKVDTLNKWISTYGGRAQVRWGFYLPNS